MSQKTKLTFSIVSHNNGNLVDKLIDNIQKNCNVCFEIILVVNVPENTDFLKKYQNLKIITVYNQEIKGFGENHNYAYTKSNGEFFIVLNPDITIKKFDFESFLKNFDNKKVSICAPKVVSNDGIIEDSPRRFPTVYKLFKRRIFNNKILDYKIENKPISVDWVGGMFMAFTAQYFKEINGFNERFFMYLEDTEICRETKRKNRLVIFDPNHSVIHHGAKKSRKELKYLLIHLKSLIIFLMFKKRKHSLVLNINHKKKLQ